MNRWRDTILEWVGLNPPQAVGGRRATDVIRETEEMEQGELRAIEDAKEAAKDSRMTKEEFHQLVGERKQDAAREAMMRRRALRDDVAIDVFREDH